MKTYKLLFLLALFTAFSGCSPVEKLMNTDLSKKYDAQRSYSSSTQLFAPASPDKLTQASFMVTTESFHADSLQPGGAKWNLSINADYYNSKSQKEPTESVQLKWLKPVSKANDSLWGSMTFKNSVESGFIVLTIKDHKGNEITNWFECNKPTLPMLLAENKKPLTRRWLIPDEFVYIGWPDGTTLDGVAAIDLATMSLPGPPFDETYPGPGFPEPPKSEGFKWEIKPNDPIGVGAEGMMWFKYKNEIIGIWPVFGNKYPTPIVLREGLAAVRYFSSREEYQRIIDARNQWNEYNNLWIRTTGDTLRAAERSVMFQSGITRANELFTDFSAGSLTDRGMIWMMFGSPDQVWRDNDSETWSYSSNAWRPELKFNFFKVTGHYGETWILKRTQFYGPFWQRQVDLWRE